MDPSSPSCTRSLVADGLGSLKEEIAVRESTRGHPVRDVLEFVRYLDPLGVVCLAAGIYAWLKADDFAAGHPSVVNPGLFPHIIAVLLMGVAAVSLVKQAVQGVSRHQASRSNHATLGADAETVESSGAVGPDVAGELTARNWTVVLFFVGLGASTFLLPVLGFVKDSILWVLCAAFLVCRGWRARLWTLFWMCAWIVGVYYAFAHGLQLSLPGG